MSSVGWEGRVKAEERDEPASVERFMGAANEALALTEGNLPELARVYRDVVAEAGVEAAERFAELAGPTTAAAWDESRVKRYPRGTPVSGPEGGGRFAPKGAAGTGARRDEEAVEPLVRATVQELADYMAGKGEPYEQAQIDGEIENMLARYREVYEPGFRSLEEKLAGIPGVTITPTLDGEKLWNMTDPDAESWGVFTVALEPAEGGLSPDVTVFAGPAGELELGDVIDITDRDFFPADRPDLSGRYADVLDGLRGVKREGFVTLHRGMSAAEAEAWEAGDEIPVGKFFTSDRTANMAQDVAGEFPELYSWKVARADVVETEPGVFQLRRNARLRQDGTITAAGPPAWQPPPLDSLLDVQKIATELEERSRKTRAKSAEDAIRPIMSAMGLSFSMSAPLVLDLISTAGKRAAALAIPGLEDTVRSAIAQAFEEGLGVDETAALIAGKTDELAGYQAEMLARTDLIGMANGGSLIGAKAVWPEGGVVKRWVNATDSRVVNDGRIRPTHLEANGLVAELDGTFTVGESELLYPGDPAGPDGEVINCRCTLVYEEVPVTAGGWEWSEELTSAGWDESKVRRYPKGTRVSGPEGGGRFAPKESTAIEHETDEPVTPEMIFPVKVGEVAPPGTPLAVLVEGNRFWLGGKEYLVVAWEGDNMVVEMAGEGVTRTLPKPSAMTEASPDTIPRIEVTGRSLKPGSRFWIKDAYGNVTEYVVPTEGPGAERNASGLSRYVTVEEAETGKRKMLKRSMKVLVDPADFPAAAKRAAAVSVSHVTGPYGEIFGKSPGKGAAVTKAMNAASAELEAIGVTLPEDVPEISALKETKALSMGGVFHSEIRHANGEVALDKTHIAIRRVDETLEEMRDTSHHEVGHYLDFLVLGDQNPGVPAASRYASAVRDPMVAGPVMDAIDASEAIARTQRMSESRGEFEIVTNMGTEHERAWPFDRQHTRYLRDPTERFARAWEQYVATKTTKVGYAPPARLDRYRNGAAAPPTVTRLAGGGSSGPSPYRGPEPLVFGNATDSTHSFYGWYWTEEDFAPIEAEFDAMLRRLGWSKG